MSGATSLAKREQLPVPDCAECIEAGEGVIDSNGVANSAVNETEDMRLKN